MGAAIGKNKNQAFLDSLCLHEEVISIGGRKTGLKFVTRFSKKIDFSNNTFYIQYPKNQELFNLEKLLEEEKELQATTRVSDVVFGLIFNYIKMEPVGILCSFDPEDDFVYEINRRQNSRVKIDPFTVDFKLNLEVVGRTLNTEIVDISQGGLSFMVPVGSKSLFVKDKIYLNCPIRISRQLFFVNVRLKNMFFQDFRLKVGVSFENISPSAFSAIQMVVKKGN